VSVDVALGVRFQECDQPPEEALTATACWKVLAAQMPVMEVDASSIQMRLCYTNGVLDERSLGISAKAEFVGIKN
jgi:hypothetical protein